MPSGQGVQPATGDPESGRTRRNRAARASAYCAIAGLGALGNIAGPAGWASPGLFVVMAFVCALAAVVMGHIGRFRGRRLGGEGRGLALAGLVTGWVLLLVCSLLLLAVIGLIAGLAVLVDST